MSPARPNDAALAWVVTFLVGSVGYAWFANGVLADDTRWAFLPPAVLAVSVALTLPGGLLARDRYGTSLLARIIAYSLLAVYVVATVVGSPHRSLTVLLIASLCLAVASSLLIWPTLPATVLPVVAVFVSVAGLLGGVVVLLGGVSLPGGSHPRRGDAPILRCGTAVARGQRLPRGDHPLGRGRLFVRCGGVRARRGGLLARGQGGR